MQNRIDANFRGILNRCKFSPTPLCSRSKRREFVCILCEMGYLQSVLIGFELDTFEAEKIQWLQLVTGLKLEPFNELAERFNQLCAILGPAKGQVNLYLHERPCVKVTQVMRTPQPPATRNRRHPHPMRAHPEKVAAQSVSTPVVPGVPVEPVVPVAADATAEPVVCPRRS
jgi:hypothetical protein